MDIIFFDLNKKWELYNRKKLEASSPLGLCYQGFVEFFMTVSRLIFNESSMEQNVKSMVYYCKFFLKEDGAKSNQFYEIDLSDDIFRPLSQKLINEINKILKHKNKEHISTGQTILTTTTSDYLKPSSTQSATTRVASSHSSAHSHQISSANGSNINNNQIADFLIINNGLNSQSTNDANKTKTTHRDRKSVV